MQICDDEGVYGLVLKTCVQRRSQSDSLADLIATGTAQVLPNAALSYYSYETFKRFMQVQE